MRSPMTRRMMSLLMRRRAMSRMKSNLPMFLRQERQYWAEVARWVAMGAG